MPPVTTPRAPTAAVARPVPLALPPATASGASVTAARLGGPPVSPVNTPRGPTEVIARPASARATIGTAPAVCTAAALADSLQLSNS
jgi:hypothetical protein